ncbi:MAG TPA: LysM domain-containing protein [Blastocatellia bacterium]|jgi:hypothetical protein|nr:LysM domain-containing protein [Blastocatellia bacterium]
MTIFSQAVQGDPRWEGWKRTVDEGLTKKEWDEYDALIKREVDSYNNQFRGKPGYKDVDWLLFKAMLWAESGGPKNPAWKTKALQIGNTGDPGYQTMKYGAIAYKNPSAPEKQKSEGSELIMSAQLAEDISTKSINDPNFNIRLGIAYVFTKMATVKFQQIVDAKDSNTYEHRVAGGETADAIAKKVGTTLETLRVMNSSIDIAKIQPGKTVLKYRKAKIDRALVSWAQFTTANLQILYNGNGDKKYAKKLDYVLELFKNLKR